MMSWDAASAEISVSEAVMKVDSGS
jgi:hypothetical protein